MTTMTETREHVRRMFRDCCAIHDGHFALTGGNHASTYLNALPVLQHPRNLTDLVAWMYANGELRVLTKKLLTPSLSGPRKRLAVIGPQTGGAVLANAMGHMFTRYQTGDVIVLPAEKNPSKGKEKSFKLPRDTSDGVEGRHVIILDDVVSAGTTARALVRLIEECGGIPEILISVWNRGEATAEEVGVPRWVTLRKEAIPTYLPGEATCPGCRDGVPLSNTLGHGSSR